MEDLQEQFTDVEKLMLDLALDRAESYQKEDPDKFVYYLELANRLYKGFDPVAEERINQLGFEYVRRYVLK